MPITNLHYALKRLRIFSFRQTANRSFSLRTVPKLCHSANPSVPSLSSVLPLESSKYVPPFPLIYLSVPDLFVCSLVTTCSWMLRKTPCLHWMDSNVTSPTPKSESTTQKVANSGLTTRAGSPKPSLLLKNQIMPLSLWVPGLVIKPSYGTCSFFFGWLLSQKLINGVYRQGVNATTGEHVDVSDLGLVGASLKLVKAVIATGKPTTVVFVSGRPVSEPWIADRKFDA